MNASTNYQGFDAEQIAQIDDALESTSRRHLGGLGLRSLSREESFELQGSRLPDVMAIYHAGTGLGCLFDSVLAKDGGTGSQTRAAIHFCVGAGLAQDRRIFAAWCRAVGRTGDEEAVGILALRRGSLRNLAKGFGRRKRIDVTVLPPGVDLAMAYAAFLSNPDDLRRAARSAHQFIASELFGRSNEIREQAPVLRSPLRV